MDVPNGFPTRSAVAKVGSLGAFWPLLEPLLDALAPRRVCEVGVENGAFSSQLVEWCRPRRCEYVGVDPAPTTDLQDLMGAVIRGRSVDILPQLEACDAYFLDGDHNYYTVRSELETIAHVGGRFAERAPLICVHDVGWPWGRRDIYYAPEEIPLEHRHPFSTELGAVLDSEELADGGVRDPGRYAVACRAGGPKNGVLTAVEDFIDSSAQTGAPWSTVVVPMAFGLALVYRADALPPACANRLQQLKTGVDTLEHFLRVVESNYMCLFLFGEDMKRYTDGLKRHAAAMEQTYAELLGQFTSLQSAYGDLSAHADSLLAEYQQLLELYRHLQRERTPDGS